MSIQFTIKVTDETMVMYLGQMPRSRLMWQADGVNFYVLGTMNDMQYEQACNLALQKCIDFHIPAVALHRYSAKVTPARQSWETKTRKMGGF